VVAAWGWPLTGLCKSCDSHKPVPIRPRWRKVAVPVLWPVPEAAVTVFSTLDDGCCDTRNMYSNFAVNKYLHTVASGWIFINITHHVLYNSNLWEQSSLWPNSKVMLTRAVNSKGLPENLTSPQLIKKFPAVYGTRRFITTFTSGRQPSLSSARSIQSSLPEVPF